MSRTNIDIDNALIADVMRKTGAKTKREAVDFGLKTLLRLRNQADVRTLRGKLSWTGDLYVMRSDK